MALCSGLYPEPFEYSAKGGGYSPCRLHQRLGCAHTERARVIHGNHRSQLHLTPVGMAMAIPDRNARLYCGSDQGKSRRSKQRLISPRLDTSTRNHDVFVGDDLWR